MYCGALIVALEFYAYKFWWRRANVGRNFDLSIDQLAVREM